MDKLHSPPVVINWELKNKAVETSSHQRSARLSFRVRVRSSDIWEGLRAELLLLHIERTHTRGVGHQVRMAPGHISVEVLLEETSGPTHDTLEGLYFMARWTLGSTWTSRGRGWSMLRLLTLPDPRSDRWAKGINDDSWFGHLYNERASQGLTASLPLINDQLITCY